MRKIKRGHVLLAGSN